MQKLAQSRIEGVLFDMDGVLLDTERLAYETSVEVLAGYGLDFPEEMMVKTSGINNSLYQQIMMEYYGPGFPFEAFLEKYRQGMRSRMEAEGIPVKPGARELLQGLEAKGIPAAVASSTRVETVRRQLGQVGLLGYFKDVVGGDMVPKSKPDPAIFRRAAETLGVEGSRCLAIEDSAAGLQAAHGAGCITLMVPDFIPPTPALRALCAGVLESLHQVLPWLEEKGLA